MTTKLAIDSSLPIALVCVQHLAETLDEEVYMKFTQESTRGGGEGCGGRTPRFHQAWPKSKGL